MWSNMFAKIETFETKYPLFIDIFTEPYIRQNMMGNEDLFRKYTANNAIIRTFIYELRKRFDIETVRKIIEETVFKFPDNLLVTFVTSYLNRDEATKSNCDVVTYFKKTMNLPKKSEECINYITEKGIVANRSYKELPNIIIDDKYNTLKSDSYAYLEGNTLVKLDDIYDTLSYPERELVINLIENHSFNLLQPVFERFNYSLKAIITILTMKGIDSKIINANVLETLDPYFVMLLVCFIIDSERHEDIIRNLHALMDRYRFPLIKHLICYSLIDELATLSVNEINNLNDDEIKARLKPENKELIMKED